MTAAPLFWLEGPLARLDARLARGHVPQALLIHGAHGIGRRALAAALALRLLGGHAASPDEHTADGELPPALLAQPDFFHLTLPEDKKLIPVDRVRDLVAHVSLTSHGGGRKVVLIEPAETLSVSAANALLKTLEEPPGSATLLLVTEAMSRLPGTIVSRCERLRLPVPDPAEAMDWLRTQAKDQDWERLLAFAGGAPLEARRLAAAGFSAALDAMDDDVAKLARREESPVAVAKRWARQDVGLCLRWLQRRVSAELRAILEGDMERETSNLPLKKPRLPLNIRDCCDYLERLAEARRLVDRGLNEELQLAGLLMWWYGAEPHRR